ncbi:MAG TPA: sensor domain-containing diguanylate cyclase [Terracidiphilus sp.]|nr:sensor domain-containing diguanylate cyclase [Terracidiphilus sp.]
MPNDAEGRIPLADLLVFHQLARSLNSSFNLDTILRTILEQMERMVEAEFWALLMLEEDTQELYYAIAQGEHQETLRGLRVKQGEGVAGWVLQHSETLIVPDFDRDPRVEQAATAGITSVKSVIALPLRGRTGTQGVIEILNPRAAMSDYSIAFLHILADHAAIAIENARDVTRIQQLTITDDTTGLYNVRHLYSVLYPELQESEKSGPPLSLAFWDLDHFKLVNDVHGHMIGSELLAAVGRRLQKLCRKQDLAFRYGGDEFVIMMPRTPAAQALELTRGMHAALMETPFGMKSGLTLQVSASVGISCSPADGTRMHEIIGTADARMYAVKRHGRGQIRAC